MELVAAIAVLLVLSAFFSGSETALFCLSKIRVKRLQMENARNAKKVAFLLDRPLRLITTILIGNMFVNILASAAATSFSITLFGEKGITLSIVVMTVLILIFGEITPKVVAIRNPERFSLTVAPYIDFAAKAVKPVRKVLQFAVNIIVRFFGNFIGAEEKAITKEELSKAVEIGRREGVLNKKEEEMLRGVFKFAEKTAADVLVPLNKVVAADIRTPLETIRSIIKKKELSRMPIFENELDNIIGVLYAKDLIIATQKGPFEFRDILRSPFYVSADIKLDELLRAFRAHGIHIALVRNQEGRFVGVVTLQDLLEEIIGQMRDKKSEAQ